MYITAAQLQANRGKTAEVAEYVSNIRDLLSDVIGRPVFAWNVALGAPIGAFMISTRADSQAQWLGDLQKLAANATYQKLTAGSAALIDGPVETRFSQVVAATSAEDPKQFTTVTSAVIAGGRVSAAMAWAGEMLELVTNTAGTGGALTVGAAGNFNEVTWIFGVDSADEIDEVNAKLQADPAYAAKLDEGGGLFVDGASQRGVLVKLP